MASARTLGLAGFASVALLAAAAGACSGRGASVDGAGPDGSTDDAAASDGAAIDGGGGGDGGSPFVYGQCATKPLTAGSRTGPKSSVTLHWPTPWVGLSPQPSTNTFTVNAPYTYVPTGKTVATPSAAAVTLWDDETRPSDADLQKRIDDAVKGLPPANVRRFTLDGQQAVLFWAQTPPPQSGCQGCPVDPGPDYVAITLFASRGLQLVQLTGQARVNATGDVLCDIQSIALGLTWNR